MLIVEWHPRRPRGYELISSQGGRALPPDSKSTYSYLAFNHANGRRVERGVTYRGIKDLTSRNVLPVYHFFRQAKIIL